MNIILSVLCIINLAGLCYILISVLPSIKKGFTEVEAGFIQIKDAIEVIQRNLSGELK